MLKWKTLRTARQQSKRFALELPVSNIRQIECPPFFIRLLRGDTRRPHFSTMCCAARLGEALRA
jgi:hypothetical protein